ncbi:ABC transporter permease [Mesoaciditoga lauensis]|uniref:ABC transporter permease n=1 Tax=Mesoaciditoga lauensis TaxID=1495039 RepID=UPI000689433C|nr:ABC transporter permease [Mesoaciditoga lauensis]
MKALMIAWKDLKFLLRSRTMLAFSIAMPIISMLMMGYIFPQNGGEIKGKIGFYSQDLLFNVMTKSAPATMIVVYKSKDELVNALAKDEISVGAVIPKNFTTNAALDKAAVSVIPNPSNPQAGIMIAQMIPAMMEKARQPSSKNIKVNLINVDGSAFNYYDFMAPGIMAMIAIMSVSNGLAASITRERELGTMDGLMVTPINRGNIVVGKILAQTARGVVQALIVLGVSILLFGVTIEGSIWTTLLLLILGTFSFIGIGIIITSSVKEQETAQVIMTTITFPMLFFSGVFFPIEQMPKFIQYVAYVFPLTYAADALRKVMTLGVGFSYIKLDVVVLLAFALVSSVAATLSFQKLIQD